MTYHIEPPAGTHVHIKDVPLGDWYPFFMQWQVPVFVSVAYTILSFYFNPSSSNLSRIETKRQKVTADGTAVKKTKLTPMTMLVVVHNTVLAIYSAWAFRGVFPLFVRNMLSKGLFEGLCDTDGFLWNSALFVHLYLFYLSKYYELMDTVIIILKGRKASVLQIYHHAGVILVMYTANYFTSPSSVFIVWENAGVHTIMYTYYALTALGFNPPGKQYLTSLQIFQFLFGQTVVIFYFLIPGCLQPAQRIWPIIMTTYLLPLIYLFVQFFNKTYKKDTLSKKSE
ncbi:fatty acid elongase [Coemansia spiralis]|nr:fatty acid elongase [Coemansia spiralis]